MAQQIHQQIENRLKKNNFCKLAQLEKYLPNKSMKQVIFQEAVQFQSQGCMLLGYVVFEKDEKIICNYTYANKIEELINDSKNHPENIKIMQIQLLALHAGNMTMDEAVNILSEKSQSMIIKKPSTIQVFPPYAHDKEYFNRMKAQNKAKNDKNSKIPQKEKQKQKQKEKPKTKESKKEEQLQRIKPKTQKQVQPTIKNQPNVNTQRVQPKKQTIKQKKEEPKRKLQIDSDEDQYNPQQFMKNFDNQKPEKMEIQEKISQIQIKEQKQDTSGDSGKKTADIQSKSDSEDDLMEMMKAKSKAQEQTKKIQPQAKSCLPNQKIQTQNKVEKIIPQEIKAKQGSLMGWCSKPKV